MLWGLSSRSYWPDLDSHSASGMHPSLGSGRESQPYAPCLASARASIDSLPYARPKAAICNIPNPKLGPGDTKQSFDRG